MPFNSDKADRVVRFVQALHHVKGKWAGGKLLLEPWQKDEFLRPLFGTLNEDGTRQYRTAFVAIPRKNGKSIIAATLALYALFADGEYGAEVYSAASDREQASLVFNMAAQMVRMSPELSARCKIVDSQKRIVYQEKNSFYHAISAEAFSKHGASPTFVVYDEIHCAPNRDLWDVLVTGMGARTQPLMLAITTAGYNVNSICWEIWDYARKVKEGIIEDPSFFPLIYAADAALDWTDPEVWRIANPNLGISFQQSFLEQECKRAREIPAYQNTFRRLYLNQWTTSETRWLSSESWNACGVEEYDGDLMEKLKGLKCWAGVDLSQTRDLTACGLVFEPDEDGIEHVLVFTWIPEEALQEHVERDKVPYDLWHDQGWIETTGGNVTDYDYIGKKVLELKEQFPLLQVVGYDSWNAMQWAISLEKEGVPVCPVIQGPKTFAPVCIWFENAVMGKTLRHNNNPVLTWAVDNIVLRYDENQNMAPSKKRSIQRIDPAVALLNAKATQFDFEEEEPSVYETRGVLAV